ncbi:MAG: TIGR01777 family protein [Acidimicrobiia bacterium]|nr:TIGR01777 family protein [Acidimicrobiia bacterium]MYC56970.1 TIGR01777 family protein [Acidimicrobiia bacterium]MYG94098.1 TIGR01777 family protein [Acidimicrobiia bacterium]MYI30835.1 TIGR01777 family protein [Acidimicrobiia bacterium]
MRVAVTGSSGLIGKALVELLNGSGHEVVRIVRDQQARDENTRYWNPATGDIDDDALNNIDGVIHLAGANIGNRRWSQNRKRELRQSRVAATELLVEAMNAAINPPTVLVAGSGIGFYGDRDDEELNESTGAGNGFLANLTVDWETAANKAQDAGTRVALARTGLVVAANAPFLTKMLMPFKLGLGGTLGNGQQWWSWIDLDDEVRALVFLLTSELSGPVNLCSPNPITNRGFTRTLGTVLKRPTFLSIPRFGPRLLLGAELADELLFSSTRAIPEALNNAGFEFHHDDLQTTLQQAIAKNPKD